MYLERFNRLFRRQEAFMPHRSFVALGMFVGALVGLLFISPVFALEVGQKAPDFTLTAPDGKPVKLSDLTAKGPVVLFTFIQAFNGT
jgi:cytochrome oxidase Cu insertion factor (SCO1/SenC/PrrC family)